MAEVREIADDFAASAQMNYPPAPGQASGTITRTA